MIHFNIDFEIAASILALILIICFFSKRRFPNLSTSLFQHLLVCSFLASTLNVVRCLSITRLPLKVTYTITFIYIFVQLLITPLLFLYIYIVSNRRQTLDKICIFSLFPWAFNVILLILTPFFDVLFVLSKTEGYVTNPAMDICFILSFLYLTAASFYSITRRNSFPPDTQMGIFSFLFFSITLMAIQFTLTPECVLLGSASAVGVFFLFYSLQNPSVMIDMDLDVFNRKAFEERLDIELKNNNSVTIITLAPDNFKLLNETFGVQSSDRFLLSVVEYLKTLTEYNNIYRYSENSFSIFVSSNDSPDKYLNKITSRFKSIWEINDLVCRLSTSISVIACPTSAPTVTEALSLIDFSLDMAKSHGKGIIVHSDEDLKSKMHRRKKVEAAINNAIEQKSFLVYYQPIYEIKRNKFTGAEALVRLIDDELGFIPPDEFITIAEQNGTITDIGDFVLRSVCAFVKEKQLANYGIEHISVNLSVVQCMNSNFVDYLESVLSEYDVSKNMLHFEITETAAISSMDFFTDLLEKMSEHGFSLSLDDFGSGYSTLAYIMNLPFNTIKIDKSLVWSTLENTKSKVILDYITNMIEKLDMDIIAEGAEKIEHVNMLKEMGCHFIQGYYFSKPLSEDDFIKLLNTALPTNAPQA